ncbi:MAG TPA: anhydro-N-acetylmuramic acid kinase, partial [Longimicrobiales bacterium]|nr:anhydro-N-acetylmuramic acid kinase [Longimicrobiales bacterium]
MLVIGLMSGTSLDGIDAALVELDGDANAPRWSLRAFVEQPYEPDQRARIHDALSAGTAAALCTLHAELGEWFGAAALRLCAEAGVATHDVRVIGSHGQTVWHEPPRDGRRGSTLQLGCPA